jgi:NDP-sugar pyrophosphorylase family protein
MFYSETTLPFHSLEFQAVILCGSGGGLKPLTDQVFKGLLPVCNVPMLIRSLHFVVSANISDIFIAAYPSGRQKMDDLLKRFAQEQPQIHIRVVETVENAPSADVLRAVRQHVKCDLLLVSCDTVSDLDLNSLVYRHAITGSSMTSLFYEDQNPNNKEYVFIDKETSTLLMIAESPDSNQHLDLRKSLIRRYVPNITFGFSFADNPNLT